MITAARLRAFLLTTALGLASINFADFAIRQYIIASIPVPQTTSGTIMVRPESDDFPIGPDGDGCGGRQGEFY